MSPVTSHSAQVSRSRPFYARHAQAYDLLVTDPVEPWVQAVHQRLTRAISAASARFRSDIREVGRADALAP